jgi:hypothetical protein
MVLVPILNMQVHSLFFQPRALLPFSVWQESLVDVVDEPDELIIVPDLSGTRLLFKEKLRTAHLFGGGPVLFCAVRSESEG